MEVKYVSSTEGPSSTTTLPWVPVAGVIAGTVVLYVILTGVYNIWFHPLRAYPGPWWLVANRLPYTLSVLRGTATRRAKALHEQYGHVVRINPDTLSFTSGEAWRDIYGSQSRCNPGIPKDPYFYMQHQGPANISTLNDDDHHRLRRVQLNAFGEKALASHEVHVRHHASDLVSQLRSSADAKTDVDIFLRLELLVTDIISKLVLGESFCLLEKDDPQSGHFGVFSVLRNHTYAREMMHWPSIFRRAVVRFMTKRPATPNQTMWMTRKATQKRFQQEGDEYDYISCMQRGSPKLRMSEDEIRVSTTAFVIAGSETTATAIAATMYLLCKNPRVYSALTHSIRSDFPLESDMTMPRLVQHEQLNNVLQEALRLYPPVPDNLFRRTADNASLVMGKVLPPDTSVTMNVWAANTSALNFHRPDEMLPDRWSSSRPKEFEGDDRGVFNPFGVGPKDCLGKGLAWMEMRIVVAYLVWHFQFELTPESEAWMDGQKVFMFWEKPPLRVKVMKR